MLGLSSRRPGGLPHPARQGLDYQRVVSPMIAFLRRGLFALLAVSLVLGANVRSIEAQSQESSRYAAIVVDAATGEV